MTDSIDEERNIELIQERIKRACERVGRNPDEVQLLLATKTVSPERINRAIHSGATLIGESRAQELAEKYDKIDYKDAELHFIGHLQTNKVNQVLRYTSFIHSVDRMRLANRLHRRLTNLNRKIDILIQVNTSYEESKFGVKPEDAIELIEEVSKLDTLQIKGLMTIGKLSSDPDEARQCFRLLKEIQQEVIEKEIPGVEMDILSMGMSDDFKIAVEEGSTMVRIGTSVFGERMYPDSCYWNEKAEID